MGIFRPNPGNIEDKYPSFHSTLLIHPRLDLCVQTDLRFFSLDILSSLQRASSVLSMERGRNLRKTSSPGAHRDLTLDNYDLDE